MSAQFLRYSCRFSLQCQWTCFTATSKLTCITRRAIQPQILSNYKCNQLLVGQRNFHQKSQTEIDRVNNIPLYDNKKGELIYSGIMTKLVKGVKLFSISSSLLACGFQPFIILNASDEMKTQILLSTIMAGFIVITPLIMHFITKKYVMCIYYNKDTETFTATTFNIFIQKKDHVFKIEDVEVPDVPGAFSTVKVKGFPLLIDPSQFLDQSYYVQLMGYDRPITDFIKKEKDDSDSDKKS